MQASVRQVMVQPMDSASNWGDAFDVVVIGGGAAGIGATASILRRRPVAAHRNHRAERQALLSARLDAGRRRSLRHRENGLADGGRDPG